LRPKSGSTPGGCSLPASNTIPWAFFDQQSKGLLNTYSQRFVLEFFVPHLLVRC
jgi:hypothetical protein